jgi:hypothetical protein
MAAKTVPTDVPVEAFLSAIESESQRGHAVQLHRLFHEATGDPGTMWGRALLAMGSDPWATPSS